MTKHNIRQDYTTYYAGVVRWKGTEKCGYIWWMDPHIIGEPALTKRKSDLMPLVQEWRSLDWVEWVKVVKVKLPSTVEAK